MKKPIFLSIPGILLCFSAIGQVYTNVEVGQKNAELKDSIMATPYKYILPIWGAKAAALGYSLPYSALSSTLGS